MNFNQYFQKVFDKKDLLKKEAEDAFNMIMSAKVSNIEISSFLVALSLKGISHNELVSAVKVLRAKSTKIKTIKHNLDDTAYITLTYSNKLNVFLKNSWISPEKIRLIKFKFQRAIIYCDENEPMYKIKIFISKNKDNTDFNLKIPEINLNEPLSMLVDYVYKSIKNNNNPIFENKLNIKITKILKNLSK